MIFKYLTIGLLLLGFITPYEINKEGVERILKRLSSDEMRGRAIGSKGIEKAADFISNEFKSTGLSEINGAKNFKQQFNAKSISSTNTKVVINGKKLTSSSFFIRLSSNSISWSNSNMPKVIHIKAEDNFRQLASKAIIKKRDYLVIVSLAHKSRFSEFYSNFSQPDFWSDLKGSKDDNVVFVLADILKLESFEIEAKRTISENQLTNIVGIIPGNRNDETIVFSAHYDHLGVGPPIKGDSIYNGANDNASGVTAVIELARYFKSKGKPERTLMFVAFTAEEVGGVGSRYFSKQFNPDELIAMINIEMIGKESKKGLNSAWMTGWNKSDLGQILQENLQKIDFEIFEDPYPRQQLFYRSDNATLAKMGVPAHSITTTQIDVDKNYHKISDEIKTLNITNIVNTIKAIAIGSQGLVDGIQTPSRVVRKKVRD